MSSPICIIPKSDYFVFFFKKVYLVGYICVSVENERSGVSVRAHVLPQDPLPTFVLG